MQKNTRNRMTTKPIIYNGSGSAIDNYQSPKPQNHDNWGLFDKNNSQHKAVLSQLRQLQWTTKSEKWGEVADINRLSDFLQSDKSPVRKPLKDMDQKEVSKIIECLKSMLIKKFK